VTPSFIALSESHVPQARTSVHAAAALLEALVRISACLSVVSVHRNSGTARWAQRRGMAGEAAALSANVRALQQSGQSEAQPFANLLSIYDRFRGDPATENLRNRAQHGSFLPDYESNLSLLVRTNDALVEALEATLREVVAGAPLDDLRLEPFFLWREPQLAVLEEWRDGLGYYWMFGDGPVGEATAVVSNAAFVGINSRANLHRRHGMIDSVVKDVKGLGGFVQATEVDDDLLTIQWALPVLDGDDERTDVFRLGAVPEWEDRDGFWRPFGVFLMDVLHWKTLLPRLQSLAQTALDRRLGTTIQFESSFLRAQVALEDGSPARVPMSELRERVVGAASSEDSGTSLFFVEGTAGAGKSVALASFALDLTKRSLEAHNESAVRPAALFVSSEGHLMANIDTAISRVVDATPGLSASAVKVLVKHGLMVLLVDGLDELLGDASYRHAIGSFSSWASGLAGRGAIVASARSSYFASALMSANAGLSEDLTPELWRIAGLSDEQIQTIWRQTNGGAGVNLDTLSASAREALRIPFLCFEAAREFSGGVGSEAAVRRSLIEGYLQREVGLLQAGGIEFVDSESLQSFLVEIAGLLLLSGDRSLSDEDLRLAAAAADIEDETVINRLRVMCGLAVEDGQGAPRFVFEHDLYFDHFHALAVLEAFRSKRDATRLLEARSIERWALDPIISGMGVEWCAEWLSQPYPSATSVVCATRGNLFLELIERGSAPESVSDVALGDSSIEGWTGRIARLDAEVLRVGPGTELMNGRVGCLVLTDSTASVTIGAARVQTLRAGSQYLVGDEVRTFLASPERSAPSPSERHPVQKLLSELERRQVRNPVVLEPDYLPNDNRMSWIDRATWMLFIAAARRANVVDLVRIPSRGAQNTYRTKFSPPLVELADRSSADPTVRSFWSEVDSRS
jgi:hypothetical protein